MNPWQIVTWRFPSGPHSPPGEHPAVILTPQPYLDDWEVVNVLACSSARAQRGPKPQEVLLDEADGLDWPTLCKCSFVHVAPKSQLGRPRGSVTPERRQAILRTLVRVFGGLDRW